MQPQPKITLESRSETKPQTQDRANNILLNLFLEGLDKDAFEIHQKPKIETKEQLLKLIGDLNIKHPELNTVEKDDVVLNLISFFLESQNYTTSDSFALLAEHVDDVKRLEKVVGNVANGGKCASTLEMILANQLDKIKLEEHPDPEAQALIDFVPPNVIAMNQKLESIIRRVAEPIIQGVFQNANPLSLKTVTHHYSPDIIRVLSKLIKDKMINQEPPAEFVQVFREIWDSMGLANKRFIIRSSSRAEDGSFAFPGVGDSTVVPMVSGWDVEERFNYSVKVAMSVFASLFNEAGILARLTNVDLENMLNFNPAKGEFMGALVQELVYPENQDIADKSDIEIAKSFVSYYCFGDKAGWTVLTALWGNGGAIADSKASQSVLRINNEVLNDPDSYIVSNEIERLSAKKSVVYCEKKDAPGEKIVFKEYFIPAQGKALILEENELDQNLPISERWKRYVTLPEEIKSPFDEIPGLEDELFAKVRATERIKGYKPDQEGAIIVNRGDNGEINSIQAIKKNKPVQSRPITGGNEHKVEIVGKFPELNDAIRDRIIRNSIPVEASFHPGITEPSTMLTGLSIPTDTSQALILLAKEVSMEAAPLYKLQGVAGAIEGILTGPTTHGAVTFGEADQPIISGLNIKDLFRLILGEGKYNLFMGINAQIETETGEAVDLNWIINVETKAHTLSDLQKQQVDLLYESLSTKKFILCAYRGLPGVEEGSFAGSSGFLIEVNSETQDYVTQLLEFQAIQEENKFNLGKFLQENPLERIKFGRNATETKNIDRSLRQGINVNTLIRGNQLAAFINNRDKLNFLDPKGSEVYDQFMDELVEELYALISPMKTSNYRVIAAALEEIWCKDQQGIKDLISQFGHDKFSPINGASFVKAFPEVMKHVEMEAIKRVASKLESEDAQKAESEKRKIDFTLEFPKNAQEVNWFLDECVDSGLHFYKNIELGITLESTRMISDIAEIRLPEGIDNFVISIGSNDLEAMSNNVSRSFAEGNVSKTSEDDSNKLSVKNFPDIVTMFRNQTQLISDIEKAAENAIFLIQQYEEMGRKVNIRFDLCGGILSKSPYLLGHIVKAMKGLNGYFNFPTKSKEARIVAMYSKWLEENYDESRGGYILPEFVQLNLKHPEFAKALSEAGIY